MAKDKKRPIITLECGTCSNRNYSMTKNKRKHPERVEYKKYCPTCNTHTNHKETR